MAESTAADAEIAEVLSRVPAPDTVAVLASVDRTQLSSAGALDLLLALERHIGWLQGLQQEAILGVAGRVPADSDDWNREEVAVVLNLAPTTAQQRVDTARVLVDRLPGTLGALHAGELTYGKARAVGEAVHGLGREAAADVERRVLPPAPQQSLADLRRSLRRAVAAADPIGFELAAARAVERRAVRRWPEDHAMSTVAVTLPALDAEIVWRALDGRARAKRAGDRRTLDQRRADALVDLAREALADPSLPRAHGRSVQPQVLIELPTLLGLADEPAHLPGYGPLPASVGRAVAGDGAWRRWVTEPVTGHLLDYGRTTYRPPQELVDFVLARDSVCLFPACNQPSYRCDLDHREPYDGGGSTSAANVAPLCERHHRLKTVAGWRLVRGPDGNVEWVSPVGRRYPGSLSSGPEPEPEAAGQEPAA